MSNDVWVEEREARNGQVLAPGVVAPADSGGDFNGSMAQAMLCPNCGSRLEGRKCKLFCLRPGCGYLVTCAEW
jgi:hypothetical protein